MSFISESIKPVIATIDTAPMATGAPGLPREFTWRGKPLHVAAVLRTWKETSPCTHGGSEVYVRKHWFEIQTPTNQTARIYFERKAKSRNITKRWWLYSIGPESP